MSNNKLFGSRNPIMSEERFTREAVYAQQGEVMTMDGAINKSLTLFLMVVVAATIGYVMPSQLFLIGGIIGGLITVLVATFKPSTSPITAPLYAGFKGVAVGTISAIYAAQFQGIVFNAVFLTLGTLLLMLVLYKYRIVRVTQKFRAGIIMATGAIFIVYLMAFIFSLFGYDVPYIHSGGMLGIGFSLVVVGIASLNLLLDFDNFEQAEAASSPKYMEWFCALGLIVTIVWLYIEMLRLLSKLNRD